MLPGLIAAVLLLAGCARPPVALRGTFPPLGVAQAQSATTAGERVRWGGEIVSTRPGRDATCLEVVSKPLDRQARPARGDASEGRFIACAPGFYDPAIYAQKREVTVVGTVQEPVTRAVGEYDYRFPMVQAETVFLWAKRTEHVYYYDPWYDPFWGPYPYGYWYPRGYFGFGLGGRFGGHHHHHHHGGRR